MKTQMLLFCFGVLFSLPSAVAQNKEEKSLLLKLNGTETFTVALKKSPQYWLKGDYLFLKTPDAVQQYEVGSVKEIVFQDGGYSDNLLLSQETMTVYPTLTTDYVYLKGMSTHDVKIVSSSGLSMPIRAQIQDGLVQLDVSDYSVGVYQVMIGGRSYKFIKGRNVN